MSNISEEYRDKIDFISNSQDYINKQIYQFAAALSEQSILINDIVNIVDLQSKKINESSIVLQKILAKLNDIDIKDQNLDSSISDLTNDLRKLNDDIGQLTNSVDNIKIYHISDNFY